MTASPNKRRLNELIVRRLQPQSKPFVVWDSLQRGLALRHPPDRRKELEGHL